MADKYKYPLRVAHSQRDSAQETESRNHDATSSVDCNDYPHAIPFDWNQSTSWNWSRKCSENSEHNAIGTDTFAAVGIQDAPTPRFLAQIAEARGRIDYSHHSRYVESRKNTQNQILWRLLGNRESQKKRDGPWLIFTAGSMGAGKSHTMQWMATHKIMPLHRFVHIDTDEVRSMLPETSKVRARRK